MSNKEHISWQRIIGSLIEGFGTKLIVAGIAIYAVCEAASFLSNSLAPVVAALGGQ